jgi:GNAT superfamily N-acetyltransferase
MKLTFRKASNNDLHSIVQMLADDALGATREDPSIPLHQGYLDAFNSIDADPNNELIVVEHDAELIGLLQLTFIPYLSHLGSWRCLIESVRIHSDHRGQGLGTDFFHWAIQRAKEKNCKLIQLTSDKLRPNAIRFYEGLGFKASHEGFKLKLD